LCCSQWFTPQFCITSAKNTEYHIIWFKIIFLLELNFPITFSLTFIFTHAWFLPFLWLKCGFLYFNDIINSMAASKYFSTMVKDKEQLGMLQLKTVNTNLYSSSTTPLTTTTTTTHTHKREEEEEEVVVVVLVVVSSSSSSSVTP
jgi:hypothetical protein